MQNTITPFSNDTFFAMFTHDLKTPINSGIFALEMLLKNTADNLNDTQKELLTDILNASKYMKTLTENALCKFKSESGKFVLHKENCSIKKLTEKCIAETKYILTEKNQTLNFICEEKDISSYVDIIEISRVITNLISNASKYSPKNSSIDVTLKQLNKKVYFEIQDYGYGISIEKLSSVFDQYTRILNKEKSAGTGLGLYITKIIIDAHDGEIKINSKENKGTKISFSIPQ